MFLKVYFLNFRYFLITKKQQLAFYFYITKKEHLIEFPISVVVPCMVHAEKYVIRKMAQHSDFIQHRSYFLA